jgi:hypothetical protein
METNAEFGTARETASSAMTSPRSEGQRILANTIVETFRQTSSGAFNY